MNGLAFRPKAAMYDPMFKSAEMYRTAPLVKRLGIRQYLGQHKGKLAVAIACMLLVAAATAANAWIMASLRSTISSSKKTPRCW